MAVATYCALAGCASYRPAPVSAPALIAARGQRVLPSTASWSTAALLEKAITWAPATRESAAGYRSLAAAARASRVPLPAALQLTAEYSHDDNPDKPWLGSGILDLPLEFGGRRARRARTADLAVVQARYIYADAVWTTRSAIARARVDRIFADRLAPLAARAVALRQDRYNKLQARVRAGEDARPIVITAQLDVAAAERRVRDIAARRGQADIALANAMGLDPAATRGLALEPLPAAIPVPSAADVVRWRQVAGTGRADLLRAIIDYDLAENAVRLEVTNQYPALRIQPGYTYERGLVKLPFGLTLALPPVDLNRAAIAAAEARRAQAGAKLETVQATILGEVDRAADALGAQMTAEQSNRARDLPVAQGLARTASAGLRAGEIDRVDEDAAMATAVDAAIALLEASRLAWLSMIDLEDAARRSADPRDEAIIEAAVRRMGETT